MRNSFPLIVSQYSALLVSELRGSLLIKNSVVDGYFNVYRWLPELMSLVVLFVD